MTDLPRKIAFVGDYLPRQCGIATFTHDLRHAVAAACPEAECFVVPVTDIPEGYDYPEEVRFEIAESDIGGYQRAADFINFSNTDVVSLQHEYGIYGGAAGSHILALLRTLSVPVVSTLHTVLREPTSGQRRVLEDLIALSARVVVMAERGKTFLQEIYGAPADKIDVIPHGIPDIPFVDPNFYKDQFAVEGKHVLLTFGLLSPGKGIEVVLKALPRVLREIPNLVYIVLGATHPNLVKTQGEAYRLSLERLAHELGIEKHVIFYNRFVEPEELKEFIGASDIFITPYLSRAQITSGTLSYAVGCGKAVISTPYWHAEELLADGRGALVPSGDIEAMAHELLDLLKDEPRRHAMRKKAYLLGREMIWSKVAQRYVRSFQKARRAGAQKGPRAAVMKTLKERPRELPRMRLDQLARLTDAVGIFQHARFILPNYHEGYCTDDNARGLILTMLLEQMGRADAQVQQFASAYAAFVDYAYDPERRRFRNFMSFDRQWLEEEGSDDCQGRALWALGACVGRSQNASLQMWAAQLFDQALPMVTELSSPRAWAFALLGIHDYFRRLSGDRAVNQIRDQLTQQLVELYEANATDDWLWFEETVSYSNAKIPHALILSGRWTQNAKAFDIGLKSLRWLTRVQTAEAGHFRPIGSNGFYPKDGSRAHFDQQPIEAQSMVSACLEAFLATQEAFWQEEAWRAFEWFLGRNDVGLPLYDSQTGGCHDGLHVDRVNQNQGAESTLAFLLALAEMQLLENSLRAFSQPVETHPAGTTIQIAR